MFKLGWFSCFALPSVAVALTLSCTAPKPGSDIDAESRPDAPNADATTVDAPTVDSSTPDASIADAAVDAGPDAFVCSADEFIRCDGDDAVFCNAAGDAEVTQTCLLGCNVSAGRCTDVQPSNDLGQYLDLAADGPALIIPEGSTINTDSGIIEDSAGTAIDVASFFVPPPIDGVAIRVFPVKSLVLNSVEIIGDAAVAFVSDGDIQILGVAQVAAGAFAESTDDPCLGQLADNTGGGATPGSGGGGFGEAGGDGGEDNDGDTGSPGAGGRISGNQQLVPLRGGCGIEGAGIEAGGAVQLVSRTKIQIQSGAFVDVNGRGGLNFVAALGGTSGGGVLLEAPAVVVAAQGGIVANGGGGAGGCSGADGVDGQRTTGPAPGGPCSGAGDGDGGNGGSLGRPAEDGFDADGSTNFVAAGGGGGGVGRIRINVEPGGYDPAAAAVVSPAPSIGAIATR